MRKKIFIKENTNFIDILSRDFDITNNFPLMYSNKECDFDALLLVEESDLELQMYCRSHLIPVIGIPKRFEKHYQMNILKKFNFIHPNSYFSTNNNEFAFTNLLSKKSNTDKLVVKMVNGARGLGQALMTKKDFFEVLFQRHLDIEIELNDRKEIIAQKLFSCKETELLCSDDEVEDKDDAMEQKKEMRVISKEDYIKKERKWNDPLVENEKYLNEAIKRGNFLVQDYIEKVKEWRLLYFFGGNTILIKRDFDLGWQANSCITGFGEEEPIDVLPKLLLENIDKLLNQFNYPWLSIDVYQDKDGKFGIFEFQMEFAFQFVEDKNKLCDYLNNSVAKKLKSYYV